MAKKEKEINVKKSIVKRVLIGTAMGTIVGAIAAFGYVASSGMGPLFNVFQLGLLGLGLGLFAGVGAGLFATIRAIRIERNKKIVRESMETIREMNQDETSKYSEKERIKICKKYAKASLYLTKRLGGTLYGEFHSSNKTFKPKDTERTNQKEMYEILEQISSGMERKKYSKKKQHLEQLARESIDMDGSKPSNFKWIKTYNNVVPGTSIRDRRTEIMSKSEKTRDRFANLVESYSLKNKGKGNDRMFASVMFKTADNNTTFANIEYLAKDKLMDDVKVILAEEIESNLKGKNSDEKKKLFPVKVFEKTIDPKTTTITRKPPYEITSYAGLAEYIRLKGDVGVIQSEDNKDQKIN